MKEFISAVEDIEAEDEREQKITALMERAENPLSREDAEAEVDRGKPVVFSIDGREMHAFPPHEGQLAFMMASLGRGQTKDQRFAAILNILFESLREEDKDYLESRLLTGDAKKRLSMKTLEGVFEHLTEQWFRPSVPSSGEAV